MHYSLRIIKNLNPMALFSHISPLFIISSPSLGPRPNSGRASPGSMTSMATSTLCAPVHPWRLTSLHTRRSEPPHRRSPVVCPKFPTLSSKNLTDFTPIFTVKLNNCLSILLWWIKLCKKKKRKTTKKQIHTGQYLLWFLFSQLCPSFCL